MKTPCSKITQHMLEHEVLDLISEGSLSDIVVDGGRAWVYDSVRSKWLSADRLTAVASKKGRAKELYLRLTDGQASNITGYRLPRNGTITAMSVQTRASETWTMEVRKNGTSTPIASLSMSSEDGKHTTSLNVDVSAGDRIQFFANTTSFLGVRDPFVWVEIAWRNDSL